MLSPAPCSYRHTQWTRKLFLNRLHSNRWSLVRWHTYWRNFTLIIQLWFWNANAFIFHIAKTVRWLVTAFFQALCGARVTYIDKINSDGCLSSLIDNNCSRRLANRVSGQLEPVSFQMAFYYRLLIMEICKLLLGRYYTQNFFRYLQRISFGNIFDILPV